MFEHDRTSNDIIAGNGIILKVDNDELAQMAARSILDWKILSSNPAGSNENLSIYMAYCFVYTFMVLVPFIVFNY